ncbi:MAG: FAD-dependent oxidoreductase [Nanoarchaeota archaeon]|nr:FAD-dependent oxidoreductase [Nanoarchaeota archaeon]MBU0976852.1 FAD-dependent oxidoreductase [Nanoarchaeota archaeon]
MDYDVVIIGSGAAGLSAAIYLARAGMKTLVVGNQKRSQLTSAFDVENYFGFHEGTNGKELLRSGIKQAKKAGATFIEKNAKSVKDADYKFETTLEDSSTHTSDYLIIASGMLSSLDFAKSLNLRIKNKLIEINSHNQTSHEKVYAAGNCCTTVRQIAKDVGDGCNAAINIIKKVKNLPSYTDYGPIDSGLDPS